MVTTPKFDRMGSEFSRFYFSSFTKSRTVRSASVQPEPIIKKRPPRPNPLYQIEKPKLIFDQPSTDHLVTDRPAKRNKNTTTIPHRSQKRVKSAPVVLKGKGPIVRIPAKAKQISNSKVEEGTHDFANQSSRQRIDLDIWADGCGPKRPGYVPESEENSHFLKESRQIKGENRSEQEWSAPNAKSVKKKRSREMSAPDSPKESAMELALSRAKYPTVDPDGSRKYLGMRECGSGQFGSYPAFDPSDDYDE